MAISPEIKPVPIKDLVVSPFNVRKEVGNLTELQNSISSIGLLQPIIVRPTNKKMLEVVVGQRRFRACEKLGWKTIPAVIRKLTDKDAIILSLTENVQMDTLDPIDRAKATEKLCKLLEKEMSRAEAVKKASQLLGKSEQTISEWLTLLQTTEAVQQMIRKREIPIQTGVQVATLPKERQKSVAEIIRRERLPTEEAAKVIKYVKEKPKIPTERAFEEAIEELEEYSITVSFESRVYRALVKFARKQKSTIQDVIRTAVKKYLNL